MKRVEALALAAYHVAEIGRSISAANAKTIRDCIKAMSDAMTKIAPLIATDEEEVNESIDPLLNLATKPEDETKYNGLVEELGKILAQTDSYDQKRYAIQSALRKRALSNAIATKVSDGSYVDYEDYYGSYPYIRDMYDDYVVYSLSGELYQCTYTITDSTVTLGDEIEVQVSYVPTESKVQEVELQTDLVVLSEKAVRDDGTARVKLISPGWGSSGYYSAEMLKRDGPKAFAKNLHMYVNHPTEEEDRNRPERDVRDLAGVIASEVTWEDAGTNNTGEGLYADVKVFPTYKEFIDAAAPYIGVSIRASGTAVEGQAEGRHGLLVDSLKEGFSVDYVTYPGRGGEILPLYESARSRIVEVKEVTQTAVVTETKDKAVEITQEEFDKLKESAANADKLQQMLSETNTNVAKLRTDLVVSEARNIITTTLAGIEMSSIVREKLQKECARAIPLTESKELDTDKLIERVKERATEELQYIEAVTGNVTGGRPTGITTPAPTELNAEEVDIDLVNAFSLFGLKENESKVAANGRYN